MPLRRAHALPLAVATALATAAAAVAAAPVADAGTLPGPGCRRAVLPGVLTGAQALRLDAASAADVVGAVAARGELDGTATTRAAVRARVVRTLTGTAGLRLDACAAAYVVDAASPAGTAPAAPSAPTAARLPAGTDVLTLHSRPGADRVIHLDVDGEDLSGSAWAPAYAVDGRLVAGPLDTDGDPATLSAGERDLVATVWAAVAEDFEGFDVDVTTQDPGLAALVRSDVDDRAFGVRALLTSDLPSVETGCRCGGIAYIGVFDGVASSDWYRTALVLADNVGRDWKGVAEAAAHEVGHTLGLSHDGGPGTEYYLGHGDWAPIMGAGYYRPVTQWSRGEYPGATNTEDDLAVMAANGVQPVPDDHPDTPAAGTPVRDASGVPGVVARAEDVDWFTTHLDGPTTVTVTPAPVSPDLDVRLLLRDAAGTTLADVDGPGLAVTWAATLPAGDYRVGVRGAARGTPSTGWSAYASTGAYTLTVDGATPSTAPPPVVATAALPPASLGVAYDAVLRATGGTAPYRWTAGGLPTWARVTPSGHVVGVPRTAGTPSVTLTVTDAAGRTASAVRPLSVANRLSVVARQVTVRAGAGVRVVLAATGGRGALTWTAKVPAGWRLSGGVLTGRPARPGTTAVAVVVTDADGRRASGTVTVRVTR